MIVWGRGLVPRSARIASALHIGVIHGLTRLVLGVEGSYVSLLRVLWLASVVAWLGVVPVVGAIVPGIWLLLIILVTFETSTGWSGFRRWR